MEVLGAGGGFRLAGKRGGKLTGEQARLLCLLAAGNWREVIRLAEEWRGPGGGADACALARRALGTEAATVLREIERGGGAARRPGAPGTPGTGAATWAPGPPDSVGRPLPVS